MESQSMPADIIVNHCDTNGIYFNQDGAMAAYPAAIASVAPSADSLAVLSLLQFGCVLPPLSPFKGVRRLVPGYVYRGSTQVGALPVQAPFPVVRANLNAQADALETFLDDFIRKALGERTDPVVSFSGGVDSSLLASRLAAMGYSETLLIHYSFGKEDPETEVALKIAASLGLKIECIERSAASNLCQVLESPGTVFPSPFIDPSVVPTADLAHAIIRRLGSDRRIIFDGIGADGAFGLSDKIRKWQKMECVPALVRKVASVCYAACLWNKENKAEHVGRLFRRSVQMPTLSAILAANALDDCLYSHPPDLSAPPLLEDWINNWPLHDGFEQKVVAAALAMLEANIFAQKSLPILESAGHTVRFPFLSPDGFGIAMHSVGKWCMAEAKAPLKHSLTRKVPKSLVYRPKSGFVDPRAKVCYAPQFLEILRCTTDAQSPLAAFLHRNRLHRTIDRLAKNARLPVQTLNTLWGIAFIDRWYRTAVRPPPPAEA